MKDSIVTLRALEPDDVDYLYKWENNPEIWKVSATLSPFSRFVLSQYIADTINQDVFESHQLRLVVEDNRTGFPIGLVDLYDIAVPDMRASVGISVNEDSCRQKGYATSALTLISRYAFDVLGLHQLHARISINNIASRRLFAKCGFSECGILREWHRTANGWEDQVEVQLINNVSKKYT